MNQWAFVIAAYAVTAAALAGLIVWSFLALRRAEKRLDDLTRP
jgi:heme exporter protein CcmD